MSKASDILGKVNEGYKNPLLNAHMEDVHNMMTPGVVNHMTIE